MTCWLFILFDMSERKNGHKDKGFPTRRHFPAPMLLLTTMMHLLCGRSFIMLNGCLILQALVLIQNVSASLTSTGSSSSTFKSIVDRFYRTL